MSIPDRLRVTRPTKKIVREMADLCTRIEQSLHGSAEQIELIEKWNQKTTRPYELHEFENYWRSIDQTTFVKEALCPTPKHVVDLSYAEAADIVTAIRDAKLPEHLVSYYIDFLGIQFPNSNPSDLIYWPDSWFDDPSYVRDTNGAFKPESDLTTDEILHYLIAKSRRELQGPITEVSLPFPIPTKW